MRRTTAIQIFLALALVPVFAAPAMATLIAPHALFIDHRVRSAALYLHNPEEQAVEISVELVYGYPRGDGEGGVRVFMEPNPGPDEPSCAAWIRALPRRVVLMPGERQAVRFLAQPPAELADGEYWSRVVVTSRPIAREDDAAPVDGAEGVRVGLTLATRTVISMTYRKGPMSTGIDPVAVSASYGERAITVDMDLQRMGNAAWLGQMDAVLLTAEGEELQRWDKPIAVYEDLRRTLDLKLDRPRQIGNFTLSLRYSTDRTDLPPEGIIPSVPVVRAVPLMVLPPVGK